MAEPTKGHVAALTRPQRRLLTAIAALDGEVLLHQPRRGAYTLGRDGARANWRTYDALEKAGLIAIRHGFAVSRYVSITDAGRREAAT